MFLEPDLNLTNVGKKGGWIEVICGSMFSGKTEELIRRIKRAQIAKQKIITFKPSIDTRYDEVNVVSHNQSSMPSYPISNPDDILQLSKKYDIVGIDEAQFFSEELIPVVEKLANDGKRVIISGLDMDFLGQPFGIIPKLLCIAEFVTKVHAICIKCGGIASYSHRIVESEAKILLGESESYEAQCRQCFQESLKKNEKQNQSIFNEN